VLIASGAAFLGIYGYSAYAPSKFAIRGLAEILRLEMAVHGISVTVACPPDTDTPQLESENRSKPALTREITAGGGLWPADKVAMAIVTAARKGRFMVGPGLAIEALSRFHSLAGPFFRLRQARLLRQKMGSGGRATKTKRQSFTDL
jgi:3-dehydrosphinganine reductase